uniref:Transmembrane protein n=1 Tax=Callorhinchus milii TaxID=7868 RepID=V9LJ39_CALMI
MAAPIQEAAERPRRPLFGGCWGCRLVCGSGMVLAGGYVFLAARRTLRKGAAAPGPGTVAQILFSLSIAAYGVVILADPVGKFAAKK